MSIRVIYHTFCTTPINIPLKIGGGSSICPFVRVDLLYLLRPCIMSCPFYVLYCCCPLPPQPQQNSSLRGHRLYYRRTQIYPLYVWTQFLCFHYIQNLFDEIKSTQGYYTYIIFMGQFS